MYLHVLFNAFWNTTNVKLVSTYYVFAKKMFWFLMLCIAFLMLLHALNDWPIVWNLQYQGQQPKDIGTSLMVGLCSVLRLLANNILKNLFVFYQCVMSVMSKIKQSSTQKPIEDTQVYPCLTFHGAWGRDARKGGCSLSLSLFYYLTYNCSVWGVQICQTDIFQKIVGTT